MKSARHAHRELIALLLVFTLFDLSLQTSLAAPVASTATASAQVVGRLATRGNRPIIVNGNNTEAGATILDGATIETPDGTGATVQLGPLGEVDLAPNTVAVINYTADQKQIKVTLKRGCAIVRRSQDATGTIETPDGSSIPADQPDSDNKKRADVCFPVGATTPVVNTGAAANAGAGAGGAASTVGTTTVSTGTGLSSGTIAGITVGAILVVIIIVAATGDDDNVSGILTGGVL